MTWPHRVAAAREGASTWSAPRGRWATRGRSGDCCRCGYVVCKLWRGNVWEGGWCCVRACARDGGPREREVASRLRTATRTSGGRLALRRRGLRGNKLTSPATHNEHCYGSTNTQESHYLGLMSIIIYSKSCTHTVFTSSHTSPTLLLI